MDDCAWANVTMAEAPPSPAGRRQSGIAIAFCGLLAIGSAALAQEQGATMVVNSDQDNTVPDAKLTLREAIQLSEGKLGRIPTAGESQQIFGEPGAGKADTIRFDPSIHTIVLSETLPLIVDECTVIEGHTLPNGGVLTLRGSPLIGLRDDHAHLPRALANALWVKGRVLRMKDIEFKHFREDVVAYEPADTGDRELKLEGVRFHKGQRGVVAKILGSARATVLLEDCEYAWQTVDSVDLILAVSGDVCVRDTTFTGSSVDAQARFKFLGDGDLTFQYLQNSHHLDDGTNLDVDELEHTGVIQWEMSDNVFQGGAVGGNYKLKATGEHNWTNNTYEAHSVASLDILAKPADNATVKLNIEADLVSASEKAMRLNVRGNLDATFRALTIVENNLALDVLIGAEASGSIRDSFSRYERNGMTTQVGASIRNPWTAPFDIYYEHDWINNDGTWIFDLFKNSIYMDGCKIENGVAEALEIRDSHVSIINSTICHNAEDGIVIHGDSMVSVMFCHLQHNGDFEIRNLSPNGVFAQCNDWGTATTDEMMNEPYPSNIERIFDYEDEPIYGFVDYQAWLLPGTECGQ